MYIIEFQITRRMCCAWRLSYFKDDREFIHYFCYMLIRANKHIATC